jgi:hypothetical protein
MADKISTTTTAPPTPCVIRRKIGGTTYEVSLNFSRTSKEDFNSKVRRLIKRDIENK